MNWQLCLCLTAKAISLLTISVVFLAFKIVYERITVVELVLNYDFVIYWLAHH